MQNTIKITVILLVVAIVALLIGLVYVWDRSRDKISQSQEEVKGLRDEVAILNNQLSLKKDELKAREESETALKARLEQISREHQTAQEALARATNELLKAGVQLERSTREVATLNTEKKALQGTVSTLQEKVSALDQRIVKLEEELQRGEKNRTLLLQELASMRLEKANLEKRWNTIGEVRGQYRALRHDEILENRRRWAAQGYGSFYTKTGTYEPPKPYVSPASQYDVKAEIRLTPATNRPPHSVSDKVGR